MLATSGEIILRTSFDSNFGVLFNVGLVRFDLWLWIHSRWLVGVARTTQVWLEIFSFRLLVSHADR